MLKGSSTQTRIVVASTAFLLLCSLVYFLFKPKKRSHSNALPRISATFQKKHFQAGTLLTSEFFDLENVKDKFISSEKSASGIRSCKLSLSAEYGFAVVKKIKNIPDYKELKKIQVTFKCWMRNDVSQAQYVLAIDDPDGKNITQFSQPITCSKKYDWNTLQCSFSIDTKFLDPENTIRIYPWNKELREFFIDDITVSYFGENKNKKQEDINSNYFFDFETTNGITQTQSIKQGIAHSGIMSVDLTNGEEFGPIITKQFGDVCYTPSKTIGISIWVYPLTDNALVELAVSLFNSKNENYFWFGKNVEHNLLPKNTWTKINATMAIPQETVTLDDVIQIIPRNKRKTKLLFDDLEIVYDDDVQRTGSASEIDPNIIYAKKFSPKRNTPPFNTLFFQKQEIGNNNSTFITDQRSKKSTDFTPGDEFIVGNFCADENDLDELIDIKSTGASLYSFCNDRSTFNQLWESKSTKEIVFNAEKVIGDFDNNGTDDVLLVNKKEKTGKLISFAGGSSCSANGVAMNINWNASGTLFEKWNVSENDVFFSGDFNGDKKQELLIVNASSGDWSMFLFMENKSWKNIASNTSGNEFDKNTFNRKSSKQIVGKFYLNKDHDVLLTSFYNGRIQEYTMMEFNSAKKQFAQKNIPLENTTELLFNNSTTTFIGNFDGDPEQEFLNLSTDWRFDLKLVNVDEKGLVIASAIDFKGYPEDHNPKYYELVKIVSGNFQSKNKTSLLILMRNCADKNFNGTSCNQYEELGTLPNSTQLYSIKH